MATRHPYGLPQMLSDKQAQDPQANLRDWLSVLMKEPDAEWVEEEKEFVSLDDVTLKLSCFKLPGSMTDRLRRITADEDPAVQHLRRHSYTPFLFKCAGIAIESREPNGHQLVSWYLIDPKHFDEVFPKTLEGALGSAYQKHLDGVEHTTASERASFERRAPLREQVPEEPDRSPVASQEAIDRIAEQDEKLAQYEKQLRRSVRVIAKMERQIEILTEGQSALKRGVQYAMSQVARHFFKNNTPKPKVVRSRREREFATPAE